MTRLGGERDSVQDPLIGYVKEPPADYTTSKGDKVFLNLGWDYVSPEEALRWRGGKTGLVFKEAFINQMQRLNPDFMDHLLAEELLRDIERIPPNKEGNFTAWEYLKGLKTVFVPNEKRERNVNFIDTEKIDRNTFHVTDEFEFTNGSKTIRPDIVFLINGVPVFFVETKAVHKVEGVAEAVDQIRRYHQECPELLAMLQIYALTHIVQYYYSATWNTTKKLLFNWKEETEGDFEALVKTFFDKENIISLLTDFILFTRQDDELNKVVLRPHQIRTVGKLIERAESDKKRGLVWHTQGSGKTYTMIVTAQQILENQSLENPTVIMLVDRNELESQLFGNLSAVGFEHFEVARSKKHLRNLLSNDTRGLIVSMIHKFEDMPENMNTRDNIFVLVDEAHRTTGGKLGNFMMGALPNATYMGFTGTPIDKTSYGKGTFIVFGKDDPPYGYLDKYSIAESIEDGATVPLHYSLAPNELRVDKETLEKEFLNLAELEGVSDIEELNKVLDKAVNLRNMLKNRERVEKVASYIKNHYTENIEPLGYKAFLVCADREACAFYKEELDKHFPPEYSEVVISKGPNDALYPHIYNCHLSDEQEKRVRKAFKKPNEPPYILIVTEKLLTGFDAPILYCMYLDKPMRDHVLLQAIARVNRPYEDDEGRKKPSGFVLDFVGIFEKLEKALAFDSQDIEGVVHDIKVLKERFAELMEYARSDFLQLVEGKSKDKAVEAVLEHFKNEEKRHEFYQYFREVSDIYDIISPDSFLRPYIEDYEKLAKMYKVLRSNYEPGISVDREFSRKTAKLVQEYTKSGVIKPALDVYEIDEDTLRRIEESDASDTEKVFNLIQSIRKAVKENSSKKPYLIPIGEKAETIIKMFQDRQITTKEALEELKNKVSEANSADKENQSKDLPVEVFSAYWVLKGEGIDEPEDKAKQLSEVLEKYPYWKSSDRHKRGVKQELYGILLGSGDINVKRAKEVVEQVMKVIEGG